MIKTALLQLLWDCYERWYRPDAMAVVAVGHLDVESIEARVNHHHAPSPAGRAVREPGAVAPSSAMPSHQVPGYEESRTEVFTGAESPGTRFVFIRKLAPNRGRDRRAFRPSVVERLAFMMLNARLFERARVVGPCLLTVSAAVQLWVRLNVIRAGFVSRMASAAGGPLPGA